MNLLISTPNTNPDTRAHLYRDGLEVIGLEITEGGVSVTFRVPSSGMYLCHPPRRMPDMVWREEYTVTQRWEDGGGITREMMLGAPVLVLDKVVEGKHVPAAQVPERVEWPDDKGKGAVPPPPCGLGSIRLDGVSAAPWDGTTIAS